MTMQTNFDVVVIGGNADGLALAASLAESGNKVLLLESRMKLGGELLTESFLTSHRYDLSGGWQLADSLAPLAVEGFVEHNKELLFPEIPIAFLFDQREPLVFYRSIDYLISQAPRADQGPLLRLFNTGEQLFRAVNTCFSEPSSKKKMGVDTLRPLSRMTVKQLLDDQGYKDQRLRCALTYLPLALGYDIETPGSAAALAFLFFGLSKMSLVDGGSGLLVNALADRIIVQQGLILESAKIASIKQGKGNRKSIALEDGRSFSASAIVFSEDNASPDLQSKPNPHKSTNELGVYRLYLDSTRPLSGFQSPMGNDAILKNAYMVSFGFNREQDIYHYLKMIRAGQPPFVAGHLINNSFVDTSNQTGALGFHREPLWCTACHSTAPAQLKKRADSFLEPEILKKMAELSNETGAAAGIQIRPAPSSFMWQGILPQQLRTIDLEGFRKSFEHACIERISQTVIGTELQDLRFKLTWLAHEVQEPLLQPNLVALLSQKSSDQNYLTDEQGIYKNPYSRLSRVTGLRSGQKLFAVMQKRLGATAVTA